MFNNQHFTNLVCKAAKLENIEKFGQPTCLGDEIVFTIREKRNAKGRKTTNKTKKVEAQVKAKKVKEKRIADIKKLEAQMEELEGKISEKTAEIKWWKKVLLKKKDKAKRLQKLIEDMVL